MGWQEVAVVLYKEVILIQMNDLGGKRPLSHSLVEGQDHYYPDHRPDRLLVIVVYASKWAVSASLLHEYVGVYCPVTFMSRTLKPNEINSGMAEKEVLALL